MLTYEGFKNGENESVLTQKPIAATSATKESEPGEYSITASGGSATNYTLSYVDGKLTVTKKSSDVTLTAKSYTRVYGDANPTFEYTVSGGAISSGQPAITCSATKASSVGAYDIVISQGTISDSNVQYTNGTLTITAAPLIISAGSYTMRQGDSMPLFTASYNGFKNGEDEDVLMSKPQLVCEAGMDSAPGTYKITIGGATAKNYNIEICKWYSNNPLKRDFR